MTALLRSLDNMVLHLSVCMQVSREMERKHMIDELEEARGRADQAAELKGEVGLWKERCSTKTSSALLDNRPTSLIT